MLFVLLCIVFKKKNYNKAKQIKKVKTQQQNHKAVKIVKLPIKKLVVFFFAQQGLSGPQKSIYPKSWKESFTIPIYKSGDKNDPNNYRGVSLINFIT